MKYLNLFTFLRYKEINEKRAFGYSTNTIILYRPYDNEIEWYMTH
tara:strand:+ start:248 stop:382 length:135 start_codon:yes stop_codon:yes gene_type:complete